jgi:hypothetical protein
MTRPCLFSFSAFSFFFFLLPRILTRFKFFVSFSALLGCYEVLFVCMTAHMHADVCVCVCRFSSLNVT